VGSALTSAGKTMTAGLTLPLLGAGTAAVTFANKFNSGMANVASLGTEAAAAVEGWAPMVQEIAIATGKSTSDMTGGLYQVVSAFGVADDTLQVLETNARAAAAGLATTEEAIGLTSAVTKAYGDTNAEAVQHTADLALRTVQLGQTTFPELAAGVGRVAPLMAQLGGTQEELFGIMASATGVTGGAAEVSTQLRGVLQSLMAPTEGMSGLLHDLGYESGAAMLQGEGLQRTIMLIAQMAEQTNSPLQNYIGSIEGQTLALAVNAGLQDATYEKTLAMADAAGAANEAFAAQTEGINKVGFGFQQAKVQAEVWAQQIGQQLLPVISNLLTQAQPFIDWISGLIQKFSELDPKTQGIILALVGVAAAAGPVLIIAGTLVTAIGALLSPIGLVIAAAAALALAWQTNFGGIRDFTLALWPAIQQAFEAFKSLFTGNWQGFLDQIKLAWEMGWTVVTEWLGNLWAQVEPKLAAMWASVQAWFAGIDWYQLGYDVAFKITTALINLRTWPIEKYAAFWENTKAWFGSIDWGQLGLNIVQGIVNGIQNAAGMLWEAIKGLIDGAFAAGQAAGDMHSPSRKAAKMLGLPIPQGAATGVMQGSGVFSSAIGAMVSRGLQPAGAGAGGTTIGDIYVTPGGAGTPTDYGRSTRDGILRAARGQGLRF